MPLYGQLFSYFADHWCYLSAPARSCLLRPILRLLRNELRPEPRPPRNARRKIASRHHCCRATDCGARRVDARASENLSRPRIVCPIRSRRIRSAGSRITIWRWFGSMRSDTSRPRRESRERWNCVPSSKRLHEPRVGRREARPSRRRASLLRACVANRSATPLRTCQPGQVAHHHGQAGGGDRAFAGRARKETDLPEARATLGLVLAATGRGGGRFADSRRGRVDVTGRRGGARQPGDRARPARKVGRSASLFSAGRGRKARFAPRRRPRSAACCSRKATRRRRSTPCCGRSNSIPANFGGVQLGQCARANAAPYGSGRRLRTSDKLGCGSRADRLNLAATLLRIGDRRGAEAQLREVLQRRPDEPNATKMLAALMQPAKSP